MFSGEGDDEDVADRPNNQLQALSSEEEEGEAGDYADEDEDDFIVYDDEEEQGNKAVKAKAKRRTYNDVYVLFL